MNNLWKRNLALLWFSQLLSLSGSAMALPFIPLFIRDVLRVEAVDMRGIYVAAFAFCGHISFAVFNPIWGMLADRYGRRIMLLRANFGAALLFPLMVFAHHISTLLLLRFVTSAFSGTVNAAQTLVVSTTPREHQGFALGALSSAVWGGNMLGLLCGGLIVHYYGYLWAFISCGIMFLLGGIIVLFAREDFHPAPPVRREGTRKLLPEFPLAIWLLLGVFLVVGTLRTLDNPYLAMQVELLCDHADADRMTGMVCAVAAVGAIFSGLLLGYLADRIAPGVLVIPVMLLSGATLLLQGAAWNLSVLSISRMFNYLAAGGLDSLFLRLLSLITPENRKGQVFGFAASFRMVGFMLAAVLSGAIIYVFKTPRSVFFAAGLLFILLLPGLSWLIRRVERAGRRDFKPKKAGGN